MDDIIDLIILGAVAIGMMFVGEWIYEYDDDREIEELGQSICDQEYDMDFESYNNNNLYCKNKVIANETIYDGITIKIK